VAREQIVKTIENDKKANVEMGMTKDGYLGRGESDKQTNKGTTERKGKSYDVERAKGICRIVAAGNIASRGNSVQIGKFC
jgi:hypothetical protein